MISSLIKGTFRTFRCFNIIKIYFRPIGLNNMGKTSFVNSALQCLVNTDELVKLCLINEESPREDVMHKLTIFFKNYLIGQSKEAHYELIYYVYSKNAEV